MYAVGRKDILAASAVCVSRYAKEDTKRLRNKGKAIEYTNLQGKYPGEKVQIDIKYVPQDCIRFPSYGDKYYQITAIDEYSRKRVLKIVKEKSTYETKKFVLELQSALGFPIRTIQVDNGTEFVNDEIGRAHV